MVVNEDHYINRILHEPGEHELTVDEFDTDYVLVAARILVDPNDPADVAEVNALQDQMRLEAASARPFVPPDYDKASLDTTRDALLTLVARPAAVRPHLRPEGGRRSGTSPDRHRGRLGRAARAGGVLPQRRARPAGRRLRAHRRRGAGRRVLVDLGLQRRGVLRAGRRRGRVSLNSVTARPERRRVDHRPVRRRGRARTPSRSWTAGTTRSASTGPGPRSSTAPGPSRPCHT